MSDLWDQHTILRKKFRGAEDKKIQKKTALRSGNFTTEKRKNYDSKSKKLDDSSEIESHQKFGAKRAKLLVESRLSLKKDQKTMAKELNMELSEYKKYESGSIIPDEKKLVLFERKLKIKVRGKEDTWKKL